MSDHAHHRRQRRAPLARLGYAFKVPPRVLRQAMGRDEKPKGKRRCIYWVSSSGVFVIRGSTVVTVLPLGVEALAALLWWAMLQNSP